MTLLGAILKKVKSTESISRRYPSPPPEVEEVDAPKKNKSAYKFSHVRAKVDSSSPHYAPGSLRTFLASKSNFDALYAENMRLVFSIKKAHIRGKVDNRWEPLPPGSRQYFDQRASFLKHTQALNRQMYKRIVSTGPRVVSTAALLRSWRFHRGEMVRRAQAPFVLFQPCPAQLVEDPAFLPRAGTARPRVRLALRARGGAALGELAVELFADVCPRTCRLFLELLDGAHGGYGYVGTRFFRKVPGLFWSGGDVVNDNGFGCYAQRGCTTPVGAENFHFSHSMPGLLSMRVTKDDEMCGVFNITFKALPQFDLRNEVFGRVIRPCSTFDSLAKLGAPLSDQPVILLAGARRRVRGRWLHGLPNTRIQRNYHTLNIPPFKGA